jgi:hypothetical protein
MRVSLSGRRDRIVKHRLAALAFALLCPAFAFGQYNSYTSYGAGTAPSYEGLWWNSSESGWGVSIAHQGDTIFAVWYTYDHDGSPTWFFMPEARLIGDDMEAYSGMMDMEMMGMMRNPPMYSGIVYRSRMSQGKMTATAEGNAILLFKARNTAVFAYTVGNVSGSKEINRMQFGAGIPDCTLGGSKAAGRDNYHDLWWNPVDSGWGINIAHQGDTLFATYYTYDASGKPEWYVMSNTERIDAGAQMTGFSGPMLRPTGPGYDATWDSSKVVLTEVSSATFLFNAAGQGSFYARAQAPAKPITRMAFSTPATVCR